MATLLLADHLFSGILSGEKKLTIRKGIRNIQPNEWLTFEAVDGTQPHLIVRVADVTVKQICHITDAEAQMDGFSSATEVLDGMKQFYPDIHNMSFVTLITFDY